MTYQLIDSGDLEKLEDFNGVILQRPCLQAIWDKGVEKWQSNSHFNPKTKKWNKEIKPWECTIDSIKLKLELTPFGHIGFFPEHTTQGPLLVETKPKKVLNLFAYSGYLSCLLAKKAKAQVTHVDSSKKAIKWAMENAKMNNCDIRFICEDAIRFCKKEITRKNTYDGILLDPPTFGRGAKNELFQIEKDLMPLLKMTKELLSKSFKFLFLSCHTPGLNEHVLKKCLEQLGFKGVEVGILFLPNSDVAQGFFAKVENK